MRTELIEETGLLEQCSSVLFRVLRRTCLSSQMPTASVSRYRSPVFSSSRARGPLCLRQNHRTVPLAPQAAHHPAVADERNGQRARESRTPTPLSSRQASPLAAPDETRCELRRPPTKGPRSEEPPPPRTARRLLRSVARVAARRGPKKGVPPMRSSRRIVPKRLRIRLLQPSFYVQRQRLQAQRY